MAFAKNVTELRKVSLIEHDEVEVYMNTLSAEQQLKKHDLLQKLNAEEVAYCIYCLSKCPKRVDIIDVKIESHYS